MKLSMIAAMGENREIGLANQLLWRMPRDMQYFKQTTMGKPIIVGRKTYESFGAHPLPGRPTIVITHDANYPANGATVVTSRQAAIEATNNAEEVMVIGGASFYEQFLPDVDRLYLTYIHATFTADSWFPKLNPEEWNEVSRDNHKADEKNPYDFSFVILERNR